MNILILTNTGVDNLDQVKRTDQPTGQYRTNYNTTSHMSRDIEVKLKVARVLGVCECMLCVFDCMCVCVCV